MGLAFSLRLEAPEAWSYECNVGALIIRIGFRGVYFYTPKPYSNN